MVCRSVVFFASYRELSCPPPGPSKESQAMVQLGNSRGFNQVIDRCIVRHPRGWSSVQVYDGGENVRVTNNRVGPAGYDETTMGRGYWADGISYAGLNGLVAGNIVTDATDGGIGKSQSLSASSEISPSFSSYLWCTWNARDLKHCHHSYSNGKRSN